MRDWPGIELNTLLFLSSLIYSLDQPFFQSQRAKEDPGSAMTLMDSALLDDLYANMTPGERQIIGMMPEDMVKRCVVNGNKNCSQFFNITVMSTVENGNCFTFNAGGEVGNVRAGPKSGMSIEFFLFREMFTFTPDNEKVRQYSE